MGADLGVPLSDLRPLCVSVAGGESRKTFTQFSKREKREKREKQPGLEGPRKTTCFFGMPALPPAAGGIPQTPSKWDGRWTFVVVLGYTRQGLGAKAQIWGNRKVGVRHHLQGR